MDSIERIFTTDNTHRDNIIVSQIQSNSNENIEILVDEIDIQPEIHKRNCNNVPIYFNNCNVTLNYYQKKIKKEIH